MKLLNGSDADRADVDWAIERGAALHDPPKFARLSDRSLKSPSEKHLIVGRLPAHEEQVRPIAWFGVDRKESRCRIPNDDASLIHANLKDFAHFAS